MTETAFEFRRTRRSTTIALALLLMATNARAEPTASRDLTRPILTNSDAAQYSESNGTMDRQAFREPRGALPLREALALALVQNPGLAAFSWETRARESEALQAGLFPNPQISVEAENFAGNGSFNGYDSAETTVMLGQLVELGGKRPKRRQVAELERDLADWDFEVARLNVLTAVTQNFVTVLEAQRRLELADDLRKLALESLEAVSKRVEAGAASAVEQMRADVILSSSEVAKRRAEAALEAARASLAALWGSPSATFDIAVGDLDTIDALPPIEPTESLIARNPDIARWASERAHRDAVVTLESARGIPNVTVQGGVRQFESGSDTALVLGFSVPFPVFDRNQGARQAARSRQSKARSQQHAATTRVLRDLEVSIQALRASYDTVIALRTRVLPQAEKAYSGVRTGYLRGLFRYVDVLDAQRTLFELRNNELSELGQFHRAIADVERLSGTPIRNESAIPGARETK